MVLLDTEGTDAVTSESYDNSQIFTLTVLLSSVLIYNSQCVPTRADREGLKYPLNYSFFFHFPNLFSLHWAEKKSCAIIFQLTLKGKTVIQSLEGVKFPSLFF